MIEWLHFHFSLSCIGEGNGNPLQCSCLENPRDGGAWWAAICGVAQSRTRLKRLSSSSSTNICKDQQYIFSAIQRLIALLFFSIYHFLILPYLSQFQDYYKILNILQNSIRENLKKNTYAMCITYYNNVHNNYFAVHLTLTQHCISTIPQFKNKSFFKVMVFGGCSSAITSPACSVRKILCKWHLLWCTLAQYIVYCIQYKEYCILKV